MPKCASPKLAFWILPVMGLVTLLAVQITTVDNAWSRSTLFGSVGHGKASANVVGLAQASSDADMMFVGYPGDPVQTIKPKDPGALQFQIGGEGNTVYQLDVPYGVSASLGGGSGPDTSVRIYDIQTTLAAGPGLFPSDGSLLETSVGATRDALRLTQQAGIYTGDLPLTVVYP